MENNRRLFLKRMGLAGATAAIIPSAFAGEQPPRYSLERNEKNIDRTRKYAWR